MVTLAPELSGALELIELCVRRGIVVSLGHSKASADEAARAFAAGASAVTHLFNAMAPIGGRAPGLAGTALATDGIGDPADRRRRAHVSDELIRLAFAAAPGRCSLVSDAIAAAGLGDGDYRLGAVAIEVRGGVARRADGTLAGSAARLRDGLARLAELGIDRRPRDHRSHGAPGQPDRCLRLRRRSSAAAARTCSWSTTSSRSSA